MFKRNRIDMDLIHMINPTSKAALKQQCMILAQGDVKKAKEIYDFYTDGLDLPDFDPVRPSAFEGFKDNMVSFMGWLKDNQGTVAQSVDFVRGLFGRGAADVADDTAEALPPIN
jgi:hypothetical protein